MQADCSCRRADQRSPDKSHAKQKSFYMAFIRVTKKESSDKMKFELDTGDRIYQTSEITEELIKDCIDRLSRDKIEFMVLQPRNPVKHSQFVQALRGFVVETRFINDNQEFSQYSYITEDKIEVETIFVNYWKENMPPNVENWKDITKTLEPIFLTRLIRKLKKR